MDEPLALFVRKGYHFENITDHVPTDSGTLLENIYKCLYSSRLIIVRTSMLIDTAYLCIINMPKSEYIWIIIG